MTRRTRKSRGFSLIELMVVLAIVGILGVVGVMTLGDRRGNAVRTVLDEVEGVLQGARQNAIIGSVDIPLVASGTWPGNLSLDGRPFTGAYPALATDAVVRIGSESERFTSNPLDRTHQNAAVVTDPAWITTALGSAPSLATIPPGNVAPLLGALGTPLFLASGEANLIRINGASKRFETGFYVAVVGISNGRPIPGAVGMLVVPANSSTVFKFYKPAGSDQWGRL